MSIDVEMSTGALRDADTAAMTAEDVDSETVGAGEGASGDDGNDRPRSVTESSDDSSTALKRTHSNDVVAQQSEKPAPYIYHGCGIHQIARRVFHITMNTAFPFLYYLVFVPFIPNGENVVPFVFFFLLIVMVILEKIRTHYGILMFSMREYERHQFAALAWTVVALCIVLTNLPKQHGIPVCVTLALVDPLMGELRRFKLNQLTLYIIGFIVAWIVWGMTALLSVDCVHWYVGIIAGPLQVIAEKPVLKVIDDNAAMLFAGLVSTRMLYLLIPILPLSLKDTELCW